MGHATHFLQRLDRVDELQVELALTLYRDPELLKVVLGSVALPADAERVAVSLRDPVQGPFVVLTRTGQFVTCLGEGMRANNLPVITRAQFDVAVGRVQRMRDELDRIKQLVDAGGEGEIRSLGRTLVAAGPRFCREDARRLGVIAPLLAHSITEYVGQLINQVFTELPRVAVLRCDKLGPRERDYLLEYARMFWTLGNTLPLLAVSETRQLTKQVADNKRGLIEYHLSAAVFELLTIAHGHRALWVMARSGKDGLAHAQQSPRENERISRRIFRELALGAIAFGSPSLRARAVHKLSPSAKDGDLSETVAHELRRVALTDAEQATQTHLAGGRKLLRLALSKSRAADATADLETMPIPDDVAHAVAANLATNWLAGPDEVEYLDLLCVGLPWLARAPLEELYLPRVWADRLLPELSVESTEAWLTPLARVHHFGRPRTVTREAPPPQRNAACTCGSGKKWKRCCGFKRLARPYVA